MTNSIQHIESRWCRCWFIWERSCEPNWRIKRFCCPGEPSLLPLLATTKEARVIFFSSRQVSGGLVVYFKERPLAHYIISGPLEGALEDTRSPFINHGWGLLCFLFFPRIRSLSHKTGGRLITRPDGNVVAATAIISLFLYIFFAPSSEPKAIVRFVLVCWNIYLHCWENSNYSFIHWQPSDLNPINHPMNHRKCFTVIKYEPDSSEEWFICLDQRCSVCQTSQN